MSATLGESAQLVTASSALVGPAVPAQSSLLTRVTLLLLILGLQVAEGQAPQKPLSANMEDARARASADNETAARKSLAMAYYKKGDLAHAREQFESLHASAPHDVSVASLLAYVYVKLGKKVEAVHLLTPLEPGNQNNTDFEYVLAFCLIQSGNDKEGVPRMEKVARAIHSANAYVIAGSTHLQRGEARDALTDLNAALRLDPATPGLSTMVGQAEYALGDLSAASLSFQRGLRANPEDFTANLDLGALRLKQRDFNTARPLLDLALRLQPKFPLARLEMAKLNFATGKCAESAAELEDLVKTEPNWFEAHWQLSMAYFELGRSEEGKRERTIAQQLKAREQNDVSGTK